MKNKKEILNLLCYLEEEIKSTKELTSISDTTNFEDIKLGFHLSQILTLTESLEDILNNNNKRKKLISIMEK
ncbi:hypothetical protein H9660_11900 [Clostridium sp. Sa3CUN1]|uniref:Uncharacterized protein n=1 Tax=Clostridium gallinarum TaxID=2762246 RepID=A0ABR8Q5Z7_9CLOT|nr:hypothetical protein [Clostridium gallinarum]MBD7915848.1 hypothetical protein [Clostridium gallinarum]